MTPSASPVPPQIPATHFTQTPLPGDDPDDRVAIPNMTGAIEAILRQPRRVLFQLRQPGAGRLVFAMLVVSLLCCLIYGVIVGTFSMGTQLWAAPVKIAGGLLFSALICLPSLYIFACLSGSEAPLSEVFGLMSGMLLLMTILLIGFAPVAWLFSQSTESVALMGALHLIFWFVAAIFGLRFLRTGFSHSKARTSAGFNTWAIIFVLVVLQMTTALRPIVGSSDTFLPKQKKFFLTHWSETMGAPTRNAAASSARHGE